MTLSPRPRMTFSLCIALLGLGILLFIGAYIEPKRWDIMRDVETMRSTIPEFPSLVRTLEQEVTGLEQNPAVDHLQTLRKHATALRLQVIRWEGAESAVHDRLRDADSLSVIAVIGAALGGLLAGSGLNQWYRFAQRHHDQRVTKEAPRPPDAQKSG